MGCDITVLSKHNLNLASLETLAVDLANRLGYSIDYGYFAIPEYSKLLGNDLAEAYVSLGCIEKTPVGKKMRLVDEHYQQKQLYEKYGDALFAIDKYWYWREDARPGKEAVQQEKQEILSLEYTFDTFFDHDEYSNMSIYNHIVSNDLHYYTRWWDFCKTIQLRDYFDEPYFQQYRKAIMNDTLLLGGEKAYFVNDQCCHLNGVAGGDERYCNWEELEDFIRSQPTLQLVSISKTVLDANYQLVVRDKKDRDLAFFDDFADILH